MIPLAFMQTHKIALCNRDIPINIGPISHFRDWNAEVNYTFWGSCIDKLFW